MTKQEHYAKLLAQRKQRALAEITRLESIGFIVSENVKAWASSPTPTRITKGTFDHSRAFWNVHAHSKIYLDIIRDDNRFIIVKHNPLDRSDKS